MSRFTQTASEAIGRLILEVIGRAAGALVGPEDGFYVRIAPVRPGMAARIIGPRELHTALAIAARIEGRATLMCAGADSQAPQTRQQRKF